MYLKQTRFEKMYLKRTRFGNDVSETDTVWERCICQNRHVLGTMYLKHTQFGNDVSETDTVWEQCI